MCRVAKEIRTEISGHKLYLAVIAAVFKRLNTGRPIVSYFLSCLAMSALHSVDFSL
jgi:hypothetical protein